MMNKLPDKVYNAMIDGLTSLHLLRLPSAPPAKGIEAVAMVWEKALLARASWSDADAVRLATAFEQVAATAERWPLPKQVLENLPPRPLPPALPKPNAVPCPPDVAEMLDQLVNKMTNR